ncbi:MAG: tetratricopeptide repeat protein [Acidobacteriota bacterium]
MRAYYEQQGVEAWRKGIVPHYITSNPFIAQSYARQIVGLIRDLVRDGWSPDKGDAPLHVVELGAGSGRFSFLLLRAIEERLELLALPRTCVRYVATDLVDKNVAYMREHPQFVPFFDDGRFDVAQLNLETGDRLLLQRSETTIGPGDLARPLVLIGNYIFDSLTHDMFRVERGALIEIQTRLRGPAPDAEASGAPPEAPAGTDTDPSFRGLRLENQDRPVDGAYYDDPVIDDLLDHYRTVLDAACVLMPIGAIRAMRRMAALADGRMMVLSSDKAFQKPADFDPQLPYLALHGSASMTLNLHALGAVTTRQGGEALMPTAYAASLSSATLLWGFDRVEPREVRLAFRETFGVFSPDDFFAIGRMLQTSIESMRVEDIVAYVRYGHWDADVLHHALARLTALVQEDGVSSYVEDTLLEAIERVWANHYHLGEQNNLPHHIGRLLEAMGHHAEALRYHRASRQRYQDHPAILLRIAVCQQALGDLDAARSTLLEALTLDPAHEDVRNRLHRVNSARARRAAAVGDSDGAR